MLGPACESELCAAPGSKVTVEVSESSMALHLNLCPPVAQNIH